VIGALGCILSTTHTFNHAPKQGASRQLPRCSMCLATVQAVGNVGFRSGRGRHTTRSAVLLDLRGGGLLVDTPGFNYPAMDKVTPENVQQFFPEILRIQADAPCKFSNCTHVHEPRCSVRGAQWERYPYYVRYALLASAPRHVCIMLFEVQTESVHWNFSWLHGNWVRTA
jgi:hypothetical protein